MKKMVLVFLALMFVAAGAALVYADKGGGLFTAKPGEEIYVCACGASCKCGTMAHRDGECACGQKLVKASVSKIEKGTVFYTVNGKQLSAPQQGKYMCGCGEGCDCGFVSQKPGKCGCGKDMVKVGT
jgi:hypothetical protein